MSITLKDIAKKANVAESTVSRALNDKAGVSQSTKIKILKIAKKNNYRPNQLARGLAIKKTNMIAVITDELDNQGQIKIVKEIEKEAEKAGYQIILCNTKQNPKKEKSYLSLLESNQVEGAIFIGDQLVGSALLKASLSYENNIVLVNRLAEENFFTSVLTDYSHGIFKATKHLIEQGFKNIAILAGSENSLIEAEKLKGYKKALKNSDLKLNHDLIFKNTAGRKAGYNSFLKLCKMNLIPDAFISTQELTTIGLVEAIKTGGYFIPDDFALIGYGDTILSSIIEPPLSVLSEPIAKLGSFSFAFLLNLINNNLAEPQIKVLSPKLIVRESSIAKYN